MIILKTISAVFYVRSLNSGHCALDYSLLVFPVFISENLTCYIFTIKSTLIILKTVGIENIRKLIYV